MEKSCENLMNTGYPYTCYREGELLNIQGITNDPCITCTCMCRFSLSIAALWLFHACIGVRKIQFACWNLSSRLPLPILAEVKAVMEQRSVLRKSVPLSKAVPLQFETIPIPVVCSVKVDNK
ncbi:conserved hypothetical protein [Trichinella spiralis]|uniref:hypothetical protein n=1 Tax=Trichinella spiralis TaxID=6334 RepID=UPI0001EFD313|nr:conserved hypothetical protein [Trichinella spiralis]